MELKVWVEGMQRVIQGINNATTCQDVIYALAHATGKTGRFVLIEKWRTSERSLSPQDQPLRILAKWGEYASDIHFVLRCLEDSSTQAYYSSSQSQLPRFQGDGASQMIAAPSRAVRGLVSPTASRKFSVGSRMSPSQALHQQQQLSSSGSRPVENPQWMSASAHVPSRPVNSGQNSQPISLSSAQESFSDGRKSVPPSGVLGAPNSRMMIRQQPAHHGVSGSNLSHFPAPPQPTVYINHPPSSSALSNSSSNRLASYHQNPANFNPNLLPNHHQRPNYLPASINQSHGTSHVGPVGFPVELTKTGNNESGYPPPPSTHGQPVIRKPFFVDTVSPVPESGTLPFPSKIEPGNDGCQQLASYDNMVVSRMADQQYPLPHGSGDSTTGDLAHQPASYSSRGHVRSGSNPEQSTISMALTYDQLGLATVQPQHIHGFADNNCGDAFVSVANESSFGASIMAPSPIVQVPRHSASSELPNSTIIVANNRHSADVTSLIHQQQQQRQQPLHQQHQQQQQRSFPVTQKLSLINEMNPNGNIVPRQNGISNSSIPTFHQNMGGNSESATNNNSSVPSFPSSTSASAYVFASRITQPTTAYNVSGGLSATNAGFVRRPVLPTPQLREGTNHQLRTTPTPSTSCNIVRRGSNNTQGPFVTRGAGGRMTPLATPPQDPSHSRLVVQRMPPLHCNNNHNQIQNNLSSSYNIGHEVNPHPTQAKPHPTRSQNSTPIPQQPSVHSSGFAEAVSPPGAIPLGHQHRFAPATGSGGVHNSPIKSSNSDLAVISETPPSSEQNRPTTVPASPTVISAKISNSGRSFFSRLGLRNNSNSNNSNNNSNTGSASNLSCNSAASGSNSSNHSSSGNNSPHRGNNRGPGLSQLSQSGYGGNAHHHHSPLTGSAQSSPYLSRHPPHLGSHNGGTFVGGPLSGFGGYFAGGSEGGSSSNQNLSIDSSPVPSWSPQQSGGSPLVPSIGSGGNGSESSPPGANNIRLGVGSNNHFYNIQTQSIPLPLAGGENSYNFKCSPSVIAASSATSPPPANRFNNINNLAANNNYSNAPVSTGSGSNHNQYDSGGANSMTNAVGGNRPPNAPRPPPPSYAQAISSPAVRRSSGLHNPAAGLQLHGVSNSAIHKLTAQVQPTQRRRTADSPIVSLGGSDPDCPTSASGKPYYNVQQPAPMKTNGSANPNVHSYSNDKYIQNCADGVGVEPGRPDWEDVEGLAQLVAQQQLVLQEQEVTMRRIDKDILERQRNDAALTSNIDILNQEIRDMEAKQRYFREEQERLSAGMTLKDLETSLEIYDDQKRQKAAEIEDWKKKLEDLEAQLNAKSNDIEQLIEQSRLETELMASQECNFERELEEMRRELKRVDAEGEELGKTLVGVTGEINKVETVLKEKKLRIEELTSHILQVDPSFKVESWLDSGEDYIKSSADSTKTESIANTADCGSENSNSTGAPNPERTTKKVWV